MSRYSEMCTTSLCLWQCNVSIYDANGLEDKFAVTDQDLYWTLNMLKSVVVVDQIRTGTRYRGFRATGQYHIVSIYNTCYLCCTCPIDFLVSIVPPYQPRRHSS